MNRFGFGLSDQAGFGQCQIGISKQIRGDIRINSKSES